MKSIHQAGEGVRTLRKIHPNSSAAIRELLRGLGRDNKVGITAGSGGKVHLGSPILSPNGASQLQSGQKGSGEASGKGIFQEFGWIPTCSKEKGGGGRALCRFSWKEEQFHEVSSALPRGVSFSKQRDKNDGIQQQPSLIPLINSQSFPGLMVCCEFCISGMILKAHLLSQVIARESQLPPKT